jgi:hypoxanthine phosphoribosyltransferase
MQTEQTDKVELSFSQISRRLRHLNLPDVDLVLGIATGGIVPASLVAHQLDKPLSLVRINHRAEDNTPVHAEPVVLLPPDIPADARHVLLVDDVSVSGKTLTRARQLLEGREVTTLVMKGSADFVVFPDIAACVLWPWKVYSA